MKRIVLLSLLLLGAFYVEAQVLVCKKGKYGNVSVRNEMHDTIMKPFREHGKATGWTPRDVKKFSEYFRKVKKSIVNQEIEDKLKEIDGYVLIECFFDAGGRIIDVVFWVKEGWERKLSGDDWKYMYNQLKKIELSLLYIEWEGVPNYGRISSFLYYGHKF